MSEAQRKTGINVAWFGCLLVQTRAILVANFKTQPALLDTKITYPDTEIVSSRL